MPMTYGSPRGLLVGYQIQVVQESAGITSTIDTNSTALLLSKGASLSGKSTGVMTHDSTGRLILSHGIKVSNAAGGLLTANSTALIIPAIKIGALASYITVNSTGIKIGSLYISCNSTGNTTT